MQISSLFLEILSPTLAKLEHVKFAMKGGVVVKNEFGAAR
jgi:hypothetical protein